MVNFNYKYAVLNLDMGGICIAVQDRTDYILDPSYVPIEDDTLNYALKCYYPIPDEVTDFSDFQGKWYADKDFSIEIPELNA